MNTTDLPIVPQTGVFTPEDHDRLFSSMIQPIRISVPLTREHLVELGRRGPYHRYVNFPVELTTPIAPSGC